MRDLVFLRNRAKQLLQQLYPHGRAFQAPMGSDGDIILDVKSNTNADFLYEVENFVASILPDSELFDELDARNWERRLGLDYDPESLTIDERKAEILRKLSYPGGFKSTLTLEFLEYQLRTSLFDVRVFRNPGLSQPANTELIANSVDKEEGFIVSNFHHTFIIAGETPATQAIIESRRRNEFIRKVLKYKPMNMVCFLNSTISKADGAFKLKYADYFCELIEETPPYATNVTISGIYEVGKTLTGSYTYNDDEGDAQSGTTFKWYRADDQGGTNAAAIIGATGLSYALAPEDANKYVAFGVTVKNVKATGAEIISTYEFIDLASIPVITSYQDKLINTLTWTIIDGSQNSGTWEVSYQKDGGGIFIKSGIGSPRAGLLEKNAYNSNFDFKVRRISSPTTEWSDLFTQYVDHVGLIQVSQANVKGVGIPSSLFCSFGNSFTTSDIYLTTSAPLANSQLYFKANDNTYHAASRDNLIAKQATGALDLEDGIMYARFDIDGFRSEVWNVDPFTGMLINVSGFTCNI